MSQPNFPITRARLLEVLAGVPDNEIVGNTFDCFTCPLANVARVAIGQRIWWYVNAPMDVHPLPAWAIRDVAAFDALSNGGGVIPITAAQARAALAETEAADE